MSPTTHAQNGTETHAATFSSSHPYMHIGTFCTHTHTACAHKHLHAHTHTHTHTHTPVSSSTSSLGSCEGEELCKKLDDIDDLSLDFLELGNPTMEGKSTATAVQLVSVELMCPYWGSKYYITGTLKRKVLKRNGKSTSVSKSLQDTHCYCVCWSSGRI